MEEPLVSIIIPVYNVDKYLRQCLNSVLAQTLTDYEVLLIDDGSTDESGIVCDNYASNDKRFSVYHTENRGSAAARQFGFELSKGKFIVAIDSDDWVDSAYLEIMLACMEENSADCVVNAYWYNKKGEDTYRENRPSGLDVTTLVHDVFVHKYHAGLWNKMFKRSILMNGVIKAPGHDYYEDMHVYISYLQFAGKVVYSDCACYHYRCHDDSLTNKSDLNFRIKMTSQMLHNMRDLYDQYSSLRRGACFKALCACANNEKLKLLYDYPSDYHLYRGVLLDVLPQTYSLQDVKGIRDLRLYFAMKGWTKLYYLSIRNNGTE